MTIVEKLTQIADNEQKVYDAGYTEGINKGGYADGHEEGYAEGKTDGIEIGRAEGYEDGAKAEQDRFWDILQGGGKRTNYTYAFYGEGWKDEVYNPKYPITVVHGNSIYNQSKITDTKVPIDITNITANGEVFNYASGLKTVRKLVLTESSRISSRLFGYCPALENITLEGMIGDNMDLHWSTNLSANSIKNIMGHLSDTASDKTLTLSQTAVGNAELVDGVRVPPGALIGGAGFRSNPIPLKAGDRIKVELFVSDDHFLLTATYDKEKYKDYVYDPNYWGVALCVPGDPAIIIRLDEPSYVYEAKSDEDFYVMAYIDRYKTDETSQPAVFMIRAALVDEEGNELTGENLYSVFETYGITNLDGWDVLVASKPNWTISLV